MFSFKSFQTESNLIEGIHRVREREIEALEFLVSEQVLMVENLVDYVKACEPGAEIRREHGMNVKVGRYRPPRGGPHIVNDLRMLLADCNNRTLSPFDAHVRYEMLHPFTDGNGRSGRALWL